MSREFEPEIDLPNALIADRRIAFVGKLGGVNRKEARRIVRRLGGIMIDRLDDSVDLIVVGADVFPMDDPDELFRDEISQAVAEQRIEVITETRFWQQLGLVEPELNLGQLYTPAMLADLLNVPIGTIRRWHRRGLIIPTRQVKQLPYFDYQEVASARRIADMIASGANPVAMENKLTRLAELYPDLQRPLTQLSVILEGGELLLRQGGGLVEPNGQKRIDFDANERVEQEVGPATISMAAATESLEGNSECRAPEDFLRMAADLEDRGEFSEAIEVYRSLALAHGPSPSLCFRLAELLYQANDLAGARERYFMAVEMEDAFVEARASLGCVLVELGEFDFAISAFEGALRHHPDYPDVHFHLARLLDDLLRPDDACHHWRRFLALTPRSPWAVEARQRLDESESVPF